VPFHLILDPFMNPVPVAVSVKAALPAVAELGLMLVNTGAGLLILNVCAALVPPPGNGVKTVKLAVPAALIFVAGTTAVICVALMKVVANVVPFQLMVDPLIKLDPVAVSVNAAVPAMADVGVIVVNAGAGLFTITVLMVNGTVLLVPPPGVPVKTDMAAVPAAVILVAGTIAVNCVALTYVVVSVFPPHFITELLIKPVPFTTNVKLAPPANAALGDIDNVAGVGFWVVTPPPPPLETSFFLQDT